MTAVTHARVVEQLTRLRLRYVAERVDAVLAEVARSEPTYLEFLDLVLRQGVEAQSAHARHDRTQNCACPLGEDAGRSAPRARARHGSVSDASRKRPRRRRARCRESAPCDRALRRARQARNGGPARRPAPVLQQADAAHHRRARVSATNQVVTQWGTVFGDDVLAAAILDRHGPRITKAAAGFGRRAVKRRSFHAANPLGASRCVCVPLVC